MARALLIKPTTTGEDRASISINFEPLGLMYIVSFLNKFSSHDVKLIDAQAQCREINDLPDGKMRMGLTDEALARAIAEYRPDVVGISTLFTRYAADAIRIAGVAKSACPAAKVVVGGMDASVRYEDYLRTGSIDLVVVGSGEEPLMAILDQLEAGEEPTLLAGTAEILSSGEMRKNPEHRPKIPFDDYPFPARDCLPRSLYDKRKDQWISYPFTRDYPAILIQSSRGCPVRCAFCEIISVFDKWNAHSAEYVVDEMEHCVKNFGTREFIFLDDNFMVKTKRVAEICRLIVERKLDVSIDILPGIAVWTLTEDVLDLMIQAGLYRVCLPIESAAPETLEYIGKPINLDHVSKMIDYCNRKGLLTYANLIIGFPFEKEESIKKTLDWGMSSGLDAVNFIVAMPFKGSKMYEDYASHGWLHNEGTADSRWRTQYFTSEELYEMTRAVSGKYIGKKIRFFLTPANFRRYLLPKVASWRNIRYLARVAYTLVWTNRTYMGVRRKLFRPSFKNIPWLGRRLADKARQP